MRYLAVVLALAARVALAGPPSGYQCGANGKTKVGVGCECAKGYVDKRDAENVAICVAVVVDPTSGMFIKGVENDNLELASQLASKLDGSTDTKAAAALTKSFDGWLVDARRSAGEMRAKGRCAAIVEVLGKGFLYREIWGKLMEQLDKRNPALGAGSAAMARVDKQLEPITKDRDGCIVDAAKQDGSVQLAGRKDPTLDACLARFDGSTKVGTKTLGKYTITANIVVDVEGNFVKKDIVAVPNPPRNESEDPRFCIASLTRLRSGGVGRAYAAHVVLNTGNTGSHEGTLAPAEPGSYPLINVTKTRIELKQAILFEFNKGVVRGESFPVLDEVVAVLTTTPKLQLEIQSHSDERGDDAYNMQLTQARADAIRGYLIGRGIDAGRLTAKGYGETMPVDSGHNETAWAKNRRIELVIVGGAK